MSNKKVRVASSLLLAALISVASVSLPAAPANAANLQQTLSNPLVNWLANGLGLGGLLSFFTSSVQQASTFMAALNANNTDVPAGIITGDDGLQVAEVADAKLRSDAINDMAEVYLVPDIGNREAQYALSQAEALGRFASSAEGQRAAVNNAKMIGSATDKSATAVSDSDGAQSTFERTNQLNKNVGALTTTSAMTAKLTLENNRLQSVAIAANSAAQKTAARKAAIETQDRQITSKVVSEQALSTVLSGPAFITPKK
jgi:hypothetical protein